MINLGLIGCGKWAKNYVKNINVLKNYAQITRLCSRAVESYNSLPEKPHNEHKWSADASDIFNDKEISAVIIASPPGTHFELVKSALEAGKNVLCEKPFTLDSGNAQFLTRLAKEKGLSLVIDYIHLWNSFYQKVKAGRPASEIQNINFIVNAPNEGREHHSVLYDWMSHDLAMLVHLFGEMPRYIRCIHNDTDILKSRIFALDCDIGDSTSSIWLNANANRRSRSIIVTYKDGATLQTVDTFEFNALREVLVDFLLAVGNNLAVSNGPLAHEVGLLLEDIQNYDQNRH